MADIRLAKPAAGTTQTVPSAPDGRFIFDFPADAATLTRNGDDLVLTFEDGSSIQLQGFYTTYSKEEMPSFQVEGVEISGQDFFAALGEDLMPAAGPAASSASRSGRYNEYGGSDLLDGIDHLGRLDIGFDGGTQLATDTVEPSAPEVDIDYEVTISGGIGADGSELTVYESGLAGGSQAGKAEAPVTANGSLAINAPDGVASIVIDGVVVFANGKLTGNVVATDEGTLTVTGYDPATGKLEFSYELTGNTTEHVKSDSITDTQISHDLTVTVTDTDGDSASSTITVNVVDDAPIIESFSHEMSEGDAVPVVGSAVTGAVAGADGAKFAWDANQNGHFGTITLNADGTYSYRLDNDNATVKELTDGETLTEEFTYTYTDADGDIAEGKVTITINGKDNGIIIEPTDPAAGSDKVTVYESGLADGSQAGQADAPTTASGSLVIAAPDGVASIVIGGIVVFEKGGLTGNTVSTDEGTLAVTGFDPVTGELKFTYELSGNTTEHSGSGMDDISHDLTVTVTDMDGTEVDSTITVNVVDDVPTLNVTDQIGEVGSGATSDTVTGQISYDFGADDGAGKSFTITTTKDGETVTVNYPMGSDSVTVEGDHGTLTVNADGSYSYKAKPDTDGEDSFTFKITDADGDSAAEQTIDVTVTKAEGPVIDDSNGVITVDEKGLDDASDASETAQWTAPDGYTIESIKTDGAHGTSTITEDGKLEYTLGGALQHTGAGQTETWTGADTVTVILKDANGNTFEVPVKVNVVDDVPTISSVDADNDGKPDITFERYPDVDSEDTPLSPGDPTDFTKYDTTTDLSTVPTVIWGGQVTISSGRVEYTYSDEAKRIVDTIKILSEGGDIAYSSHVTNGNIGNSVEERKDSMGLTVAGKAEISADRSYDDEGNFTGVADKSDAIIVTLPEGTVAYGLNLKLGAFFTQSSGGGDKWDTVPEQALLTFYKDGEVVLIYPVTANSADGSYTVPADLVITEGFDKVVISAVDNSWNSVDNFEVEQSDFVVQEIGFVTLPPNEVMFRYEGDLVSDGGADGFADGYRFAFSDKMGENMDVTLGNGKTVTATLTIMEGDNGSSILLATIPGADGKPENLFSVTLDTDGHWKFDQYQEFSKPGGSDFELGFMTKDSDGDTAYEGVTLITTTETNIGTGDEHAPTSDVDVIVDGNSGHDNLVGDPGGATESTQTTYTDLNVALVVDTSGSMDGTRMSETKEALKDLCDQLKAHADKGADVNLSLIGFSGALNINLSIEDITGIEENYRKFTLNSGWSQTTIIGKVGTEFSVTSYYSNGYISGTTTYRITEDGTLQKWASRHWETVSPSSTESLTGYEAVLEQIDDMKAIGGTVYSDGYGAAKNWFGEKNDPNSLQNNGGENIAIFVTDGKPDSTFAAQNAYNKLVGAVDDITVETIGIAITDGNAKTLLNGLTTNKDGAHFIQEADQLDDVFGEIVSNITTSTVTPAADDVILGGRGNDMLFGDALNADYLLGDGYTWEGKEKYTQGSSWDIINAYLFATFGHNPSEGEIAKFIAQNADKLGLTDSITDDTGSVRGGNDTLLGGSGDDIVYGQGGDDLLFGDGSDTATSDSDIDTLNTLDTLLTAAGAGEDGSYAERIRDLGTSETPDQPSELDRFIDSLEGTGGIEKDTDGNDQLFGGAGDDVIFGGSGNDFIDGGEGRDTIFGGSGNDIIVYDSNDYLVSGGSGIDFMVSNDSKLTMEALLSGGKDGKEGPIVDSIEVLLKGEDALSLTSIQELADKYGITLSTNDKGEETLSLDDRWIKQEDGTYDFTGDADLTLETNLTPVDASDPASEAVQQQVFTLEHGNG